MGDHRLLPIPDGQYRRSLSEDQKPTTLPDHSYLSTECMASNPLSDAKDWKTSSSYLNTAQSNVGPKFGGSTFSITRHKKIDLSAYDEELTETNPKSKNDDQDTKETLPTIGIVNADSYDVLEKAAAIALEQALQIKPTAVVDKSKSSNNNQANVSTIPLPSLADPLTLG